MYTDTNNDPELAEIPAPVPGTYIASDLHKIFSCNIFRSCRNVVNQRRTIVPLSEEISRLDCRNDSSTECISISSFRFNINWSRCGMKINNCKAILLNEGNESLPTPTPQKNNEIGNKYE